MRHYNLEEGLSFQLLLLLNKAPGHPETLHYKDGNVEVMFLPPNTTSLLQPLDQGVIRCFKATYNHLSFRRICPSLDANQETSIMSFWKDFTIVAAIMLTAETVEAVQPEDPHCLQEGNMGLSCP